MSSRIAIVGTGYVGLTTGAYLAHLGHTVVCADLDAAKVEQLNRGEVPILEAGLDELVAEGLDTDRLSFVVGAANAVVDAEFVFLCVQTPQDDDGSADLTYIREAASEIGPALEAECVVINKSTVPVGSTRVVEAAVGRDDIFVVSNPEFLREGSAVHDCLHPDRIVIGSDDQAAAMRVADLFASLKAPLVVTDPASAETIKYASNAFLATKVSYVNALANVCEAVGADVREVVLGMGYDKRIGFEFLKPGPGWGGSCFVPDETVLAARGGRLRLLTFEQLFAEVERVGSDGWSVLSWVPGEVTAELLPVSTFTARPWDGDVTEVRTKMGRRVTTTPCHPFVVGDGVAGLPGSVKRADELTTRDWLPIAQGMPVFVDDRDESSTVLDGLGSAGIAPEAVIVHLSESQRQLARKRDHRLPAHRRYESRRTGCLRLHEVRELDLPEGEGTFGTVNNGTFVPAGLDMDHAFWRMVGLYLAEGHIGSDGTRRRIAWSFHLTDEPELVEEVAGYWTSVGVKATVRPMTTACQVSVSSRILAGWFEHVLEVGADCYSKRIPDAIWTAPESHKRELLRGLWDGDGSWSLVRGGPSVVLEYGTVSRDLADGMLRLLGDLGIVARLKVGRTAKSTVDTYWLTISGADQIDKCAWLLPDDEQLEVRRATAGQAKRIAPTGYRRFAESKNAAWVRVTSTERRHHRGTVYSLEVPGAHTVVTSFGLVGHNCFPKDTRAMVHIAEEAGYDFGLLKGVITVNDEQYERMADKVERMAGGSLEGCVVAAWGLTFKARTDDIRDSPAIAVIRRLQERGATVQAYDPAIPRTRTGLEGIDVRPDAYAAAEGAEVLVVLTEWDELRWLDFAKVAGLMRGARIVDTRNLLEPAAVRRLGFAYDGLGRA
ncbi:MAG TPA: nucleotide sugar dehydrogenase [Acidimicrobiales bacterium]|nr:nucleotide sugar dehydrogenase [Acidimicrobiales bacterium]